MNHINDFVVVVVDDSDMDRYLVKRYLNKREEFVEIIEAESGVEFLDSICDTHRLDALSTKKIIVLMDINMPLMDGFETAQALQQRIEKGEAPSSLVVMMFTSSDNPEDKKRAEQIAIVEGYIVKPMDDKDVEKLVQLFENHTGQ